MSTAEAKQDLKRIRRVREEENDSSDGPEILICPIEGCSRTVVGSHRHLQSHVREAGGDHEGLGLDEDLQIIELPEEEDDEEIDQNEESDDLPSKEEESPEQAEIDPEEIDEEEYHAMWHSGTPGDDPSDQKSIYADSDGLWGPGAPKGEVNS